MEYEKVIKESANIAVEKLKSIFQDKSEIRLKNDLIKELLRKESSLVS